MLYNIPDIISPELLKLLMEMGHGDEVVLADANFPAASHAKQLISYPGVKQSELLEAVLKLFPLDKYADQSFLLMKVIPGDQTVPAVWDEYKTILDNSFSDNIDLLGFIERDQFYQRTKNAYAIIACGDTALYGSIILRKGVVV